MADWIMELLANVVSGFMVKEKENKESVSVNVNFDGPSEKAGASDQESKPNLNNVPLTAIDWVNPNCSVSKYFTVKEAITLHAWNRLATESDGLTDQVKTEIIKLCSIMDEIRELLNCPMNTHCIFRSVEYNREVLHSLPQDVHSTGMAIDWDVNEKYTIEQAKEIIRPVLEKYGLRLEGETTTWIHNDTRAVGPSGREFKA